MFTERVEFFGLKYQEREKMAKKKKKELVIEIPESMVLKRDKLKIIDYADELFYQSPHIGKKIPKKDYITILHRGLLHHLSFDTKTGTANACYEVTIADLEKLLKKAKKRLKYFKELDKKRDEELPKLSNLFLVHLNEELSFMIKDKKKK